MSSSSILEIMPDQLNAESDTPEYAHYAESSSVTEGYIMGTPVIALCGKVFIPSKDPEKLIVCPSCKKILEALFLHNE
jgi:hypothetical protein